MTDTQEEEFTMELSELLEIGDPWIDYYVNNMKSSASDMGTQRLCHMAESFGRPSSLTVSGARYETACFKYEANKNALIVYLLATGHVELSSISIPTESPPSN